METGTPEIAPTPELAKLAELVEIGERQTAEITRLAEAVEQLERNVSTAPDARVLRPVVMDLMSRTNKLTDAVNACKAEVANGLRAFAAAAKARGH